MPPVNNEPNSQPGGDGSGGQLPTPQDTGPIGQPTVTPPQQTYAPESSPVLPEPIANTSSGNFKKPRKKKWLFIGLVVLVLLLAGGGYVFAVYLPNSPTKAYQDGLSRTGEAVDALTNYAGTMKSKDYKSSKFEGAFKITSSTISGDGTITAVGNADNGEVKLNVDLAGEKVAADVRAIKASGQDQPDLYFQASGVKSLLDSVGMSSLSQLDSKWISVDHTLLDSLAAGANHGSKSTLTSPTQDQVLDALKKVNVVNKRYLFATDGSHAVLKDPKYLGKSQRDGRTVFGYEVGYDKAHLKAYVSAAQSAITNSSLNAWIKQVSGKSAADISLTGFQKAIDDADSKYTFTVYVDADTKLISALHFKDPKSSDYLEFTQGYTGGDSYPFGFKMTATTDPSLKGTLTLNASLNKTTAISKFDAKFDAKDSSGSPVVFTFSGTDTPSKAAADITAPTGATSINDVLKTLNLDSLLGGGTQTPAVNDLTLPFSLTQ